MRLLFWLYLKYSSKFCPIVLWFFNGESLGDLTRQFIWRLFWRVLGNSENRLFLVFLLTGDFIPRIYIGDLRLYFELDFKFVILIETRNLELFFVKFLGETNFYFWGEISFYFRGESCFEQQSGLLGTRYFIENLFSDLG